VAEQMLRGQYKVRVFQETINLGSAPVYEPRFNSACCSCMQPAIWAADPTVQDKGQDL